jgi:hypothetical protein
MSESSWLATFRKDAVSGSSQLASDASNSSATGPASLPGGRTFGTDFYLWHKEYGGLDLDHARRMKDLENRG